MNVKDNDMDNIFSRLLQAFRAVFAPREASPALSIPELRRLVVEVTL